MSELKDSVRIKRIREELGYTQEQFAEILELSLSGYKKLESGEVNLTIDKIYMLNRRLGLSADYILFDEKTELVDAWEHIRRLPELEKWQMFLRMYAYLAKKTDDEYLIDDMMKNVDKVVSEFLDDKNKEE